MKSAPYGEPTIDLARLRDVETYVRTHQRFGPVPPPVHEDLR